MDTPSISQTPMEKKQMSEKIKDNPVPWMGAIGTISLFDLSVTLLSEAIALKWAIIKLT